MTLQRRRPDGTWTLVATTATKADGTFAFGIARLGTYRALADAGDAWLRGSATVTVPPAS